MIKEYIRDIYPHGIREDAFNEGSLTHKYDEVRGFTFDNISEEVVDAAKQLLVITATENGILEWEKLLNISGLGRTLEERRGMLLSILTGGSTTLDLMKAITYLVVGGDASSVIFSEYWTTGATGDNTFKYEVFINDNLLSLTYDVVALRAILEGVQPAHCTLFITITNDLVDSVGVTESVETAFITPLIWDAGIWSDNTDPMSGNLWG